MEKNTCTCTNENDSSILNTLEERDKVSDL